MAEQTSRNKVNIGLSSLILIFIVLCLSTFGLLSLSSARGDLELAERGAQAAKEFYEADSKGQQWLAGRPAICCSIRSDPASHCCPLESAS